MILETFAAYFTFATPAKPLPVVKISHPQAALTLATAAVSNCLHITKLLYSIFFFW